MSQQTKTDSERLLAIGEWPGLVARYHMAPAAPQRARLTIALRFDPEAVAPHGANQPAPRDWGAALDRYRLILAQLTGPGLVVETTTSLMGGIPVTVDAGPLIGLAQQITDSLAAACGETPSQGAPTVAPRKASISFDVPFSAVAALDRVAAPLQVGIRIHRTSAPDAAVDSDLPPDLGGPSVSVADVEGLAAFAVAFETAFRGFDGSDGRLLLASRTVAAPANATPALWFVRWSASHGASVRFEGDPVFFALAPLARRLISAEACGRTWSAIDLCAWAHDFLKAFDALLAAPLAAAVGGLDPHESDSRFRQLAEAKQRLARAIKGGLAPLFLGQAGQGDLAAAQEWFEAAMLSALENAFAVTTVIQIPAQVGLAGCAAEPGAPLSLRGAIGPSEVRGRQSPCTLSDVELVLSPGQQWLTTLLTPGGPEPARTTTLPLQHRASRLRRDLEPADANLGDGPVPWLTFADPAGAPPFPPVTDAAHLLGPRLFQPAPPILGPQSALDAPMVQTEPPPSTAAMIKAALNWTYSVDVSLPVAAQDKLCVAIAYGVAAPERTVALSTPPERRRLFECLAAFRVWYAEAQAPLAQMAGPPAADPAQALSPRSADALLEAFHDHAMAIAEAWEVFAYPAPQVALQPTDESADLFHLTTEPAGENGDGLRVTLRGRPGVDGAPLVWPVLTTVDGQTSSSASNTRPAASGGGWVEAAHVFTPSPGDTLTLQFGPLDATARTCVAPTAWVTRNEGVMDGRETADPFVLRSAPVSFADVLVPLVHRGLLAVTPGPTLEQTLTDILSPLAGGAAATTLRLSAAYGYDAQGSQVTAPITLALAAPLSGLAQASAEALANWFVDTSPPIGGASLLLSVTVFDARNPRLPLVQFDEIVVPTADLPLTWWTTPAPPR